MARPGCNLQIHRCEQELFRSSINATQVRSINLEYGELESATFSRFNSVACHLERS